MVNMTRTTSGKNQEDSTWSRIARSATGLAKDVATPNGAYESTHDLSTLRSSHKLSGLNNHNNVSTGERFYKALSSRHQATGLRISQWTLDATAYDESEDELANFLRGQCSFGNESASSSRSASPLDGPSDGVYDVARVPSHLQWSPQDQNWHTVQSAMTTAQLGDSENSNLKDAQTTGTEIDAQSTARRIAPATPLDLLWDSHFEASRDDSEQDVLGKARPDFKERLQDHERNQQAARRLQLFASHIAVASSKATTSSLTKALQIPALESTYNQLCRGDESQDWAEFLASVEELAQMHHSAQQQPTTKTLQQHNNAYQQHHRIQTPSQQNSQRQEMLQSEETDDLISTFHCPWVGCRQVRHAASFPIHCPH